MIFYTDKFLEDWMGGRQIGPFVILRPRYKNDKSMQAHEREHVNQWWLASIVSAVFIALGITLLQIEGYKISYTYASLCIAVHPLLYLLSKKYKLHCEASAYAKQLGYLSTDKLPKLASHLANPGYKLGLTQAQAEKEIRRRL